MAFRLWLVRVSEQRERLGKIFELTGFCKVFLDACEVAQPGDVLSYVRFSVNVCCSGADSCDQGCNVVSFCCRFRGTDL